MKNVELSNRDRSITKRLLKNQTKLNHTGNEMMK